jgi:hypothetical protein
VDGLSSICNASSETRLHEGNLNRLARELDPHRIVHNPFMDAESETFERPRTKGAAADSGRHAENADDRGLGPSADNGGDQGADSSSREVSDAEAEDALPLATPREPLGVSEESFDIAVSNSLSISTSHMIQDYDPVQLRSILV